METTEILNRIEWLAGETYLKLKAMREAKCANDYDTEKRKFTEALQCLDEAHKLSLKLADREPS